MKLIFLDIEGVLVTPKSQQKYDTLLSSGQAVGIRQLKTAKYEPEAIENLNILVNKTDANIILISKLRRTQSVEYIQGCLSDAGFKFWYKIVKTHCWFITDKWRSDEIEDYLVCYPEYENRKIIEPKYVIIDASKDYQDYQLPNLVSPDPEKGFTSEDLKKAINILERAI